MDEVGSLDPAPRGQINLAESDQASERLMPCCTGLTVASEPDQVWDVYAAGDAAEVDEEAGRGREGRVVDPGVGGHEHDRVGARDRRVQRRV